MTPIVDFSSVDTCYDVQSNSENDNQSDLEKQSSLREKQLCDSTKQCHSHYDIIDFINSSIQPLDDSAKVIQGKLMKLLDVDTRIAYNAERKSFYAWYKYQQIIASEVLYFFWEIYAGGTGGMDVEVMHLYNIANLNISEQSILYDAVVMNMSFRPYLGEATLQQIDSTKEELKASVRLHANPNISNPENWPGDNSPEQLCSYLDQNLSLFKKWMADRDSLQEFLDTRVKELFESHTSFWKSMYPFPKSSYQVGQ